MDSSRSTGRPRRPCASRSPRGRRAPDPSWPPFRGSRCRRRRALPRGRECRCCEGTRHNRRESAAPTATAVVHAPATEFGFARARHVSSTVRQAAAPRAERPTCRASVETLRRRHRSCRRCGAGRRSRRGRHVGPSPAGPASPPQQRPLRAHGRSRRSSSGGSGAACVRAQLGHPSREDPARTSREAREQS